MAGEGQQGQQGELHVGSAGWVGGKGRAGKPRPVWVLRPTKRMDTDSCHGHTLPPLLAFEVCTREGL